MSEELETLAINTIRGLAMDGPQQAKSGHSGTAMALAPTAHVLWSRIMNYDAANPQWPNRDRFILSAGHASILLYSMLYLSGTDLTLDDIKKFRTWDSRTPGHPEIHHVKGIDITTGPLGQGVGNATGFALAERMTRARFGDEVMDHYTFVICGDGDLEEGLSHEAASLAGHLGLGKLVMIYDDNHISIDGPTELSFTDDSAKRFEAYGWDVDQVGEIANDPDAIEAAIRRGMAVTDKPTLIVLRSHIGWPAPDITDTNKAHGDPFGDEIIKKTKEILGLPADKTFYVPDEVLNFYREAGKRGASKFAQWEKNKAALKNVEEFDAALQGAPLPGFAESLPTWAVGDKPVATRVAIKDAINASYDFVPGVNSGAADLTGNTGTKLDNANSQSAEWQDGRQIHYGIREHGMAAAMVGMAFHGGTLPIGGTFFCFVDYMRPTVRLAAMGEAKVIFNWTHDSIGLGQDGPTHQPIEQLASLRAMPMLSVIRPADANETAHAYRIAVEGKGATGLVLTRQNLPILEGTAEAFEGVKKGAYVLVDTDGTPDVILIGTGSEVQLCVEAAKTLSTEGTKARVVSMPSWNLFEAAGKEYQQSVIPTGIPAVSVEAGSTFGWARWADSHVGIDHFGASAPAEILFEKFGFTPENVVKHAKDLLAK